MRDSAFYYGLTPTDYYNARICDLIAFVRSASKRAEATSREQWEIMRMQTMRLMQWTQSKNDKPIELIDVFQFADEVKDKKESPKALTAAQSDKLNAAYERYLNRPL